MSAAGSDHNKEISSRKKKKTKRKASSPLNDHSELKGSHCAQVNARAGGVSVVNKDLCGTTGTTGASSSNFYTYSTPTAQIQSPIMNFSQQMPFNMPQPQQQMSGMSGMPSQPSTSFINLSPTQMPQSQQMFTMPPPQATSPPSWATDLIDDVKHIKQSLAKLEKIEQTVNTIHMKVSNLEEKVKSLDTRVDQVEASCAFISNDSDERRKETEKAKGEIKSLKERCKDLEDSSSKYLDKITDLESRSMRDNLMFYGIPESDGEEDCELLVKKLCDEHLKMESDALMFDRVHRVGVKKRNAHRPIVAKFHYFTEREAVRKASYEWAETLKQNNVGVGMQWPQQVREARKALYPVMNKEKQNGKTVKLVRDKLFINGVEYKGEQQQQQNAKK